MHLKLESDNVCMYVFPEPGDWWIFTHLLLGVFSLLFKILILEALRRVQNEAIWRIFWGSLETSKMIGFGWNFTNLFLGWTSARLDYFILFEFRLEIESCNNLQLCWKLNLCLGALAKIIKQEMVELVNGRWYLVLSGFDGDYVYTTVRWESIRVYVVPNSGTCVITQKTIAENYSG